MCRYKIITYEDKYENTCEDEDKYEDHQQKMSKILNNRFIFSLNHREYLGVFTLHWTK